MNLGGGKAHSHLTVASTRWLFRTASFPISTKPGEQSQKFILFKNGDPLTNILISLKSSLRQADVKLIIDNTSMFLFDAIISAISLLVCKS